MNFVVSSDDLLKHLQLIAGVVPSRHVLPIVENFLFEIGKNRLTLTATDLEITMKTTLEVETDARARQACQREVDTSLC